MTDVHVVIIVAFIGAMALALVRYVNHRHIRSDERSVPVIKMMNKMAESFVGSISKYTLYKPDTLFKGVYEGFQFKFRFFFSGGSGPFISGEPELWIELSLKQISKLIFWTTGESRDRLLYGEYIETGDPDIDKLNIISYSPSKAERFLSDPQNRMIIRQLAEKGWGISISKRSIIVSTRELDPDLAPEFVKGTLDVLIELSSRLHDESMYSDSIHPTHPD